MDIEKTELNDLLRSNKDFLSTRYIEINTNKMDEEQLKELVDELVLKYNNILHYMNILVG